MLNLPAAVLFVSGITGLAMTFILITVAKSYPKYIHGVAEWANATLLASIAMFLLLGRGHIADFFSIIMANLLLMLAFIQMHSANRLLAEQKPWLVKGKLYALLISFAGFYLWFTYISPSMPARLLVLAVYLLPILIEQFIFTCKHFEPSSGKTVLLVSLGFVIIGRSLRVISMLNGVELPTDLFENTLTNIVSVAIPALTIPLSTVSCIMLASERLHRNLDYASRHDDLTDVLNKKTITEVLQQEIKRTKRLKNHLSIMLLDLDNFKNINDQYGHLMGDKVLINFAKKSKGLFRDTDYLARFGGDEFIAVLPDTSVEQAQIIANRINVAGKFSDPQWSVSIGIAGFIESDTFETILSRADDALYQAKFSGKNQTHIAQPLNQTNALGSNG